jgi:hypothetical protein
MLQRQLQRGNLRSAEPDLPNDRQQLLERYGMLLEALS